MLSIFFAQAISSCWYMIKLYVRFIEENYVLYKLFRWLQQLKL